MRCHYEVLDVPRDASETDIKVAYKKLALKWHPDKNLEDPAGAKEQFQIVQQAYEVLSDRQERAWYDNHREQILRGANSNFEDKSLDVFQYFDTSCFSGYEDDEKSFYTVYRNVFENIAKEDMEFIEDKEEFFEIPSFGNSKTDFTKVSAFYNYWLNYSTKKSFVWLDPHDIVGISDRKYVKLVEKENKKSRQRAKKERNEEVRNLVAFVKKRDKRIQAQQKIQQQNLLEKKKKRELLAKQKRLERQQELNDSFNQPEWSKFDNVKSELETIEKNLAEQFGEFTDSENEDYPSLNSIYCVACNKVFKTPKAFENHESSRKHKENIVALKEMMLNEDDSNEEFDEVAEHINIESDEDHQIELEEIVQNKSKKKKFQNVPFAELQKGADEFDQATHEDNSADSVEQSTSEILDEIVKNKSKKKKKLRNIIPVDLLGDEIIEAQSTSDQIKCNDVKDKKQKNKYKKNTSKDKSNEEKKEYENETEKNKIKDKKKKREHESNVADIDTDHSCVTCRSNFPSKNKLFDHLKKTSHGVYIPLNMRSKNKKKL